MSSVRRGPRAGTAAHEDVHHVLRACAHFGPSGREVIMNADGFGQSAREAPRGRSVPPPTGLPPRTSRGRPPPGSERMSRLAPAASMLDAFASRRGNSSVLMQGGGVWTMSSSAWPATDGQTRAKARTRVMLRFGQPRDAKADDGSAPLGMKRIPRGGDEERLVVEKRSALQNAGIRKTVAAPLPDVAREVVDSAPASLLPETIPRACVPRRVVDSSLASARAARFPRGTFDRKFLGPRAPIAARSEAFPRARPRRPSRRTSSRSRRDDRRARPGRGPGRIAGTPRSSPHEAGDRTAETLTLSPEGLIAHHEPHRPRAGRGPRTVGRRRAIPASSVKRFTSRLLKARSTVSLG